MSYRRPAFSSVTVEDFPKKSLLLLNKLRNQLNLASRVLLGLWLFLMILIPHVFRLGDRPSLLAALSLSILFQVGLILHLLFPALRGLATLRFGLLFFSLAWLAEFVGHTTGVPFGRYTYTDALWPQFGNVPIQVPAAWLMMLPPALATGTLICGNSFSAGRYPQWTNMAVSSLTSGLAFTAWDLFLDPQMVAWGMWQWESPGRYFGVPLVNFFGWTLTATFLMFVFSRVSRPKSLPLEALLLVYTAVWLLNSVGLGLFFGQPGPAAVGFVGMGIFVAAAWRQVLAAPK